MLGNKWEISFSNKAVKSLAKIPNTKIDLIKKALFELELDPFLGDVLKLKGEINTYRKRVGTYRILYTIYKEIIYIEILDIKKRDENTY